MRVENDARLIAGIAAGAASCALAAGLREEEAAALRAAVRAACEHAFAAASAPGLVLDVGLSCSESRLTITLTYPATHAADGLPLPALPGIDHAVRNVSGDSTFLILTKSIKPSVSAN